MANVSQIDRCLHLRLVSQGQHRPYQAVDLSRRLPQERLL